MWHNVTFGRLQKNRLYSRNAVSRGHVPLMRLTCSINLQQHVIAAFDGLHTWPMRTFVHCFFAARGRAIFDSCSGHQRRGCGIFAENHYAEKMPMLLFCSLQRFALNRNANDSQHRYATYVYWKNWHCGHVQWLQYNDKKAKSENKWVKKVSESFVPRLRQASAKTETGVVSAGVRPWALFVW